MIKWVFRKIYSLFLCTKHLTINMDWEYIVEKRYIYCLKYSKQNIKVLGKAKERRKERRDEKREGENERKSEHNKRKENKAFYFVRSLGYHILLNWKQVIIILLWLLNPPNFYSSKYSNYFYVNMYLCMIMKGKMNTIFEIAAFVGNENPKILYFVSILLKYFKYYYTILIYMFLF